MPAGRKGAGEKERGRLMDRAVRCKRVHNWNIPSRNPIDRGSYDHHKLIWCDTLCWLNDVKLSVCWLLGGQIKRGCSVGNLKEGTFRSSCSLTDGLRLCARACFLNWCTSSQLSESYGDVNEFHRKFQRKYAYLGCGTVNSWSHNRDDC